MKKLFLIFTIYLSLIQLLYSQNSIKVYKPKEIKFAQKFSLKFEIEGYQGKQMEISTQTLIDSDFGFVDIKKQKGSFEIFLIPFSIGISTFPEINIELKDQNLKLKSYPISLEIKPLYNPPQASTIKDISNILSFLIWLKILIALLIIISIAYIISRIKKRNNESIIQQEPDTRTPYEKAMAKINALSLSNYLEEENYKQYYSEISDILRYYITQEYQINAIKMTSNDLIRAIKKDMDINLTIKLREILEISDLVKFAKFTPARKKAEDDLNLLKEIIQTLENISQEKKKKEMQEKMENKK